MNLNQAIEKASYYAVKVNKAYVVIAANGSHHIEPDGKQMIPGKVVYIAENCIESAIIAGIAK